MGRLAGAEAPVLAGEDFGMLLLVTLGMVDVGVAGNEMKMRRVESIENNFYEQISELCWVDR